MKLSNADSVTVTQPPRSSQELPFPSTNTSTSQTPDKLDLRMSGYHNVQQLTILKSFHETFKITKE